jgi:hypothetical protein
VESDATGRVIRAYGDVDTGRDQPDPDPDPD